MSDKTESSWPRQIDIDEQFYFFCSKECFLVFQVENRVYLEFEKTTPMDDDWTDPYCDQCDTQLPGLPPEHDEL